MSLITQSNLIVARPSWGIVNATAFAIDKMMLSGYSIQKIEIVFKGKAKTKTDHEGRYEYDYFTRKLTKQFYQNCGAEEIYNFAQTVKDSYSRMIEGFRQNRDSLLLTCQVIIDGAKKTSNTEMLGRILSFGREMRGALVLPDWDHVMGALPRHDLYLEALIDPSDEVADHSESTLRLRALDLG